MQLLDRNPLAILLSFKGSPFGSSVSVAESLSPVLLFDCESRCFLVKIYNHINSFLLCTLNTVYR